MIAQSTAAVKNKNNGMELLINDKVAISELQEQFNQAFPYLKLEFFDSPPTFDGLPKSRLHPNYRLLGTCRKMHAEGVLVISPDITVGKLEKAFWQQFGLTVEVFRKSGNLWIETTLSDSWTLRRQNEEGKAMNAGNFIKPEQEDPLDRDLWQ
jgi:hypothetical protein